MPTYVYETIPNRSNEKPTRFELRQSIKDTPILEHPDTGQAVRRVISGGISISAKKGSSSQGSNCCSSSSGSCCA
jgi:predicted nucleic acid-binding Zn ribbon protein